MEHAVVPAYESRTVRQHQYPPDVGIRIAHGPETAEHYPSLVGVIIVIGEMRDMETIQVAIAAAMTGHLVISTVHTTDTIQTIERLLMMFPETQREQLAADLGLSLQAVISQRLLPRADAEGMYPAVEILLGTATVRKQISDRDFNALEISLKAGIHQGMISFNRSLFQLYEQGIITRTTALTASGNANELDLMMKGMENGNERCKLALDMFNYQTKRFVGAYAAAMGGLDCIVFTAGIGENTPQVREGVCEGLEFLGVKLDKVKNVAKNDGGIRDISAEGSRVKILVIPTNEELVIARETAELL